MRLAKMADMEMDDRAVDCVAALDPEEPADFRELAALLAVEWRRSGPRRIGLAGGQGAGKTTLGELIEASCRHVGLRACVLSLDDFYLEKADRASLARRVHPLFETRGPPGTHDMALCRETLDALLSPGDVEVPVFDKGLDDRAGWRRKAGPFDLVVLEGWCVGARGVSTDRLEPPCNRLESELDRAGVWRRAVNRALVEEYEPVWDALDALVYLSVPSLDAIRRWRLQQEVHRPPELRMTMEEVDRFVQHYERITADMAAELPARADWVVGLDEAHRVAALSRRAD